MVYSHDITFSNTSDGRSLYDNNNVTTERNCYHVKNDDKKIKRGHISVTAPIKSATWLLVQVNRERIHQITVLLSICEGIQRQPVDSAHKSQKRRKRFFVTMSSFLKLLHSLYVWSLILFVHQDESIYILSSGHSALYGLYPSPLRTFQLK